MTEDKKGIISIDELKLPPAPAKAPQIDWGEDFENFDDSGKIRYLKKLTSALNHSADLIHKERNEALRQCHILAQQVENANKNVEIQKTIVKNALESFGIEKQELIKRIQELEKELKSIDVQFRSTLTKLKKYEE